ncbi:synaptosomal-associated protein [Tupanvirus deep ocean]|uniref:Synaptosomal-associated protein n=2 Tax=Tupanvirus TaxID=2094720 RepID=A0AC62A8F5_9VIRU|nr:synaptosomal-associated protein [Tupanvirus deep ocean]QKU33933.1 synaptosomal-associated protein [Tupanvirus deep ocean]
MLLINNNKHDQMEKQQLADETVNESNRILRNALSVSYETEGIAADTLGELADQGDRLKNLHGKLDNIDKNQYQANRYLNVISSIGGYIRNSFSKPAPSPTATKYVVQDTNTSSNKIQNIQFNKQIKQTTKIQNETDELLDELSLSLGRLKEMGNHMSTEINNHNKILEDLNERVDKTNHGMKKLNDKIVRI